MRSRSSQLCRSNFYLRKCQSPIAPNQVSSHSLSLRHRFCHRGANREKPCWQVLLMWRQIRTVSRSLAGLKPPKLLTTAILELDWHLSPITTRINLLRHTILPSTQTKQQRAVGKCRRLATQMWTGDAIEMWTRRAMGGSAGQAPDFRDLISIRGRMRSSDGLSGTSATDWSDYQ